VRQELVFDLARVEGTAAAGDDALDELHSPDTAAAVAPELVRPHGTLRSDVAARSGSYSQTEPPHIGQRAGGRCATAPYAHAAQRYWWRGRPREGGREGGRTTFAMTGLLSASSLAGALAVNIGEDPDCGVRDPRWATARMGLQ
jgi:hypothetical protein